MGRVLADNATCSNESNDEFRSDDRQTSLRRHDADEKDRHCSHRGGLPRLASLPQLTQAVSGTNRGQRWPRKSNISTMHRQRELNPIHLTERTYNAVAIQMQRK